MHEGYCVKCKAKKPISNAIEEIMKNGRKAVKGKCPDCGVVMFKILGSKAASPNPSPLESTPAPAAAARPADHGHSTASASVPGHSEASAAAPAIHQPVKPGANPCPG